MSRRWSVPILIYSISTLRVRITDREPVVTDYYDNSYGITLGDRPCAPGPVALRVCEGSTGPRFVDPIDRDRVKDSDGYRSCRLSSLSHLSPYFSRPLARS